MNAAYVIVASPLAGFLILLWLGRRLREPAAGWLSVLFGAVSFVSSVIVWAYLLGKPGEARHVTLDVFTWVPVAGLRVHAALLVDPLSLTMALFVTGVGTVIFLYSIGY